MGFAEVRQGTENFWSANWTTTPTQYEQMKGWVQPGVGNEERRSWVALFIRMYSSQRASIGESGTNIAVHRHRGEIIVQVFTDLNIGTNTALALATQARDLLRDQTLILNQYIGGTGETVHIQEPTIRTLGDDGHGWYQVNVHAPFYYDEID